MVTSAAPPDVTLDLAGDVVRLTRDLCDIESVSGDERPIADAVEQALRGYDHLEVLRDGDAVVARTRLGPSTPASGCRPNIPANAASRTFSPPA